MNVVACLLLILSSLASAAPDAYTSALARGRALAAKGKHRDALGAYEDALKTRPDDPATLSEIGVSALAVGDLARARDASQRAAAGAPGSALGAASLYNLGRVEEAAHDRAKAVAAYQRSLQTWQNPTVRARLIDLDRAAAVALEPLAPKPLDGPYASLDAECEKARCEEDASLDDMLGEAGPHRPFLEVRRLALAGHEWHLSLALRLKSGWWIARDVVQFDDSLSEVLSLAASYRKDAPVVQLTASVKTAKGVYREGGGSRREDELVLICGLGPTGTPSCTPRIAVEHVPDENEADSGKGWTLVPRFHKGELILAADVNQGDLRVLAGDAATAGLAGRHILVFP